MKIAAMEEAAPPLPAVESLRRNLLHAMFQAVREDDIAAIVVKQVEKAKEGDSKAARLLIELVQAGAPTAAPTHMQQAIVVTGNDKGIRFMSDARRNMVHLLAATGPLTTVEVAKTMHLMLHDTAGALDHDWFVKHHDHWTVTPQGRAEVLLQG